MEYAKYYNATNIAKEMFKNKELNDYTEENLKGVFVCNDSNDFWICRLLEGYNDEYEKVDGLWLIERNKINKFDLLSYIEEKENKNFCVSNKRELHEVLSKLNVKHIIKTVIKMDDNECLMNWDNKECLSYEECIEVLEDGNEILKI